MLIYPNKTVTCTYNSIPYGKKFWLMDLWKKLAGRINQQFVKKIPCQTFAPRGM